MIPEEVLKILGEKGAILRGHFQLSSGRHSDTYLQCAMVCQYPDVTNALARELAIPHQKSEVNVVITPAIGGIILGYAVAQFLGCRMVFAERERKKLSLRRGFSIKAGEKVLVVEDVVTTGGTIKEMIDLVKGYGGEVIGVASLIDRSEDEVFEKPLHSLVKMKIKSYSSEDCPLCKRGIPISIPGSRGIIK
ncbi:MAG: orotate phosphoribosyltransferase [Actinomycetota bacterium]